MITYRDGSVAFVGEVIELRERYAGFERDSFEALVPTDEGFEWVSYASDNAYSGGQYSGGKADVDATPEIKAAYEAWKLAMAQKERLEAERRRVRELAKGRLVKVVKGRKVPKGTQGRLFWVGQTRFGKRVGFNDATGTTHWTAATNVEVIPTCPDCE